MTVTSNPSPGSLQVAEERFDGQPMRPVPRFEGHGSCEAKADFYEKVSQALELVESVPARTPSAIEQLLARRVRELEAKSEEAISDIDDGRELEAVVVLEGTRR